MERIKGPDFPTGAMIVGRKGIEEAYRTGRGSITMRAVVDVEEIQGRTCLVVTELPYQANPDNLAQKIADLVKDGKIGGIADVRDETSGRTGQRLVIVLKRDAVAKVVLNNLYKHTQLQDNFGANMLALVDGVPRTLSLDAFIRHWVAHQIEVIVRRTRFRLRKAEERGAHPARPAQGAGRDRRGHRADPAQRHRRGRARGPDGPAGDRRDPGQRDPRDAAAPTGRPGAPEDHRRARRARGARSPSTTRSSPRRSASAQIISEELAEIVEKYGDDRRTKIVRYDGDMSIEDLIAEEDIVVTITRGGYVKRTKTDDYRSQKRGGKGVGARSCAGRHRRPLLRRPRRTTGCCSSPTRAGSTAPRPTSCRTPAATPGASTWPTCWPSSRTSDRPGPRPPRLRAAPYLVLATQQRPGEEDAAEGLRLHRVRRRHRDQPARGRRADRRARAGLRRRRSAAGQPARRSRSGSPPPTTRCARWAARPPASRA